MIERRGSGAPWEPIVGYSRVVRAGDHVHVAGCTALSEDGVVLGGPSAYEQAVQALANVERALGQVGATLADVVRTRIYVTAISRWEEVAAGHRRRSRWSARCSATSGQSRRWSR